MDVWLIVATRVLIDSRLLEEALRVGGLRSRRETVDQALREFIRRRSRVGLLKLVGKVEYDPRYSYKRDRRR